MSWDFETEPALQADLDWVSDFVRREVEPLDFVLTHPCDIQNPLRNKLMKPLQAQVRERGLWACHLSQELGGKGFGQVKLALLNEILGRSEYGPAVFGSQAPDSGNTEILAHYGSASQKAKYLQPLLNNDIVSCFAMTEPQGGADPKLIATTAERHGTGWVINGSKWFASHARYAAFYIVVAVTDPDAAPHERMSMFIVPSDAPGIEIVRSVGFPTEPVPTHAYVKFANVEVPDDHLLGPRGQGFAVAQTRLGGGRVHHAMRTIGLARRAFEMMCERVISRHTQGTLLSEKQMVQEKIADSWIELEQFRLLVLRTAWLIDRHKDYKLVRKDIAAVKAAMPKVLHDIAARALHLHGSIGLSDEMPFAGMVMQSFHMGLSDGPIEVHKVVLARQLLRGFQPSNAEFPAYHRPGLRQRALEKYADALQEFGFED
jgi:acyl-CoA dehydrogenase